MRKKTHEEYVKELKLKNPTVEVVDKYIDARTKIMHHCLVHDVYWEIQPSNAIQGNGCPECKKEKLHSFHSKSHEQYIAELHKVLPYITVVGQYRGYKIPIVHKCEIHGVEWKSSPNNVLVGCGCPECVNESRKNKHVKTHEQYINELKLANPDVIALDNYIDAVTPILHKCLIDDYEWYARPDGLLRGSGCPKCAGNYRRTHGEYVHEVSLINPDIEVLDKYINAKTPILHRCLVDDCTWYGISDKILRGSGCPQCQESLGERQVRQWLNTNNIKYIYQKTFDDCKDKQLLPFDFYLPDYNVIIEYDGRQHFEPIDYFGGNDTLEYTQRHDQIKTNYCNKNNIKLLRIPYDKDVDEELNNFLFI